MILDHWTMMMSLDVGKWCQWLGSQVGWSRTAQDFIMTLRMVQFKTWVVYLWNFTVRGFMYLQCLQMTSRFVWLPKKIKNMTCHIDNIWEKGIINDTNTKRNKYWINGHTLARRNKSECVRTQNGFHLTTDDWQLMYYGIELGLDREVSRMTVLTYVTE